MSRREVNLMEEEAAGSLRTSAEISFPEQELMALQENEK
jgi:hypothetical protein